MKVVKRNRFTATDTRNINIDVAIVETEENCTHTRTNIKDFIIGIYGTEILRLIFGFLLVALLAALIIFSAGLLRPRGEDINITYQLANNEGNFSFKGWKLTPKLETAIKNGDISLKNITVIEKGGEIEFNGGDSNKIAVVNYETVIEKNRNPQLYSDEYYKKLCKEGKNTYVLRTIGLATEKEGAE